MSKMIQTATFANGCFWCTEAIFKRLKGVLSVTPGYTGGKRPNPSYEQIHTGVTGHAESLQITFDPQIISYNALLDVFWVTHDPTTKDRQGNDVGSEYRSMILYHTDEQKEQAFAAKKKLEENKTYSDPIVTEIVPYTVFYPAEQYHKDYYDTNREAPYCRVIIDPKVHKLLEKFSDKVKEQYLDNTR
ncbi:MAG: peptide-methionine (S)-S-oxide reductase MsrA [Patescibacteria group bacterium]